MNLQNLKDHVDFLCGSTSATYSDANKVRNMNMAYHDVSRLIWECDGGWAFDDSNNTDTPKATKSLANLSAVYTIPTTAMRIEGVEVKDGGGNWLKLRPITYQDLTQSPEMYASNGGTPTEYLLEGNEIRLFPPPGTGSVTMTSGLCVRLSRNVTELATTATTTTPGFATSFHPILSYAAAIEFTEDEKRRNFFIQQRDRLMQGLTRFYSKRWEQGQTRIKPAGKKRWRSYL